MPDEPVATDVARYMEMREWSSNTRSSTESYRSGESIQLKPSSKPDAAATTRPYKIIEYLPTCVRPSYVRLNSMRRQSRFYGWKWGILTGVVTAGCVLILNLAFLAVAIRRGHTSGVSTLFTGDRKVISRTNTALHLLINACSTLLMSANNYALQVLTAPTRLACDGAHRTRKALHVGILSFSNLRALPKRRTFVSYWLLLSSLPLHLFYNACVFQVAPAFEVALIDDPTDWSMTETTSSDSYGKELTLADLGHPSTLNAVTKISLLIDEVKIEYFNTTKGSRTPDRTSNQTLVNLKVTQPLYTYVDADQWSNRPGSDGWLRLQRNESRIQVDALEANGDKDANALLHVHRVFARVNPDAFKLSLNLPLIITVVLSNGIKLGILIFVLLDAPASSPFVTIGDAIASFLTSADPSTKNFRNYTLDDFIYSNSDEYDQERIDVKKILKADKSVAGQWRSRVRPYGLRMGGHSALHGNGLMWANISAYLVVGAALVVLAVPLGSWGQASLQRYDFPGGLNGVGYVTLALIVNAPQLLVSTLYFTLNQLWTTIATVHEYNQFGLRRKTLRVSRPEGQQRQTYFLQLPLRFAIPLNTGGGILHWLTSQTLFLVRLDRLRDDGTLDEDRSSAAWGVSGTSYLTLVTVLWLLCVVVLGIANTRFTERVPFAGTSTWVISAACHPPPTDEDPALGPVCWGRIEDDSENDDGAEQFSFSSSAVIVGPENEQGPRQSRVLGLLASLRRRFSKRRPATDT